MELSFWKIVGITAGLGIFFGGIILAGAYLVAAPQVRFLKEELKHVGSNTTLVGADSNTQDSCNINTSLQLARVCTALILRSDTGHGSAVSIKKGYLLTNYHVVKGSDNFKARFADREIDATLVKVAENYDLALLKINGDIPQCNWYDAETLKPGEDLYAIGWPQEAQGEPTVTKGIFSRWNSQQNGIRYIQTDAAINPGNSGGSLISKCGLVGINTAKFSWFNGTVPTEGLSLAMPTKLVLQVAQQMISETETR